MKSSSTQVGQQVSHLSLFPRSVSASVTGHWYRANVCARRVAWTTSGLRPYERLRDEWCYSADLCFRRSAAAPAFSRQSLFGANSTPSVRRSAISTGSLEDLPYCPSLANETDGPSKATLVGRSGSPRCPPHLGLPVWVIETAPLLPTGGASKRTFNLIQNARA